MQEVRDEGAIRATTLPPGWDEAVDLEADPATIPDPAEVEVPDSLRAEIERLMSLYPDRHSATLPALGAARSAPSSPTCCMRSAISGPLRRGSGRASLRT